MRASLLLSALLLVPFVLSAQARQAQIKAVSPFTRGSVPFALLREGWVEDCDSGRVFSLSARYAPDADYLGRDGLDAEGSGAIRDLWKRIFGAAAVSIHLTSRHTSEAGDLAYDSGRYREDVMNRGTGVQQSFAGDYLVIYQRQGLQWLIVQQAWTAAAVAAEGNR